jgi:hypothetical protein
MSRLNLLENFSRRGFIGSGVALGLVALTRTSKAVGTTEPLDEGDILGFVRSFNTMALSLYFDAGGNWSAKTGFYPKLPKVLAGIVESLVQDNNTGLTWAQHFTPAATEVFPGWTLDYDASREGHYVLIIRGQKVTTISDDSGVIYHALTPVSVSSAKDFARADQFPGAISIEDPLNVENTAKPQGQEN